jgi:hypothetical protein
MRYQFNDGILMVGKPGLKLCPVPVIAAVFWDESGNMIGRSGPLEKVFDLLLSQGDKSLLCDLRIGSKLAANLEG